MLEKIRVALAEWLLPEKYAVTRVYTNGGVRYLELSQDDYRRLT